MVAALVMLARVLGLVAILAAGVDFDFDADAPPPDRVDFAGRTCLALVGFSEARDQGDVGMAAVMQVVVNRTEDPRGRWPRTLCDAALQPQQFIGLEAIAERTRDGRIVRHPERIDAQAWQRALDIADQVIAGTALVPAACSGATRFDQAAPANRAGVVCRQGAHTFYAEPPAIAAN